MEWKHKCSLAWLKARQDFLTASEAAKLVPVTETGRPRKVSQADYDKMKLSKTAVLTEADCWSYGPAARGHWMEQQAVRFWNEVLCKSGALPKMYHWDDCLIYDGSCAWSPDAVDWVPCCDVVKVSVDVYQPTKLLEIKSYSPERHIERYYQCASQVPERWQLAFAMMVSPTITTAYLMWFAPGVEALPYHIKKWSREDLSDEIKILQEVRSTWEDTAALPIEESLIEYEREAEKACKSWLSMNPVMDVTA